MRFIKLKFTAAATLQCHMNSRQLLMDSAIFDVHPRSSSSSFGSMAVYSLGVLPPPTVYLAHIGHESVKKKK